MQIQKINNNNYKQNSPSFNANLVKRAIYKGTETIKGTVVDVYSVNKHDADFLDKLAELIKIKQRRIDDEKSITETGLIQSIRSAIAKAKKMEPDERLDTVLISVENNNKVTGIADAGISLPMSADFNIRNLAVWNENHLGMSRNALLLGTIKKADSLNEYMVINSHNITPKGYKYFLNKGFKSSPDSPLNEIIIENTKLKNVSKKITDNKKVNYSDWVPQYGKKKNIDLNERIPEITLIG